MNGPANVRLDQGAVNQRILAREAVGDYRRVEQASLKQIANFRSPEAKRVFVRYFHSLGCNSHTDDTRWAFMGTTFSGKETSRRYSAETSFHAPSKRSLWARARKVRMA